MEKSNNFSLSVMIIILALLGLFIGYLLGNWIIQLVTGAPSPTRQVVDNKNKIVDEEIIDGKEIEPSTANNLPLNDEDKSYIKDQLKGPVYVVQVGAFKDRNNAIRLKEELAEKGFEATIDEDSPYFKVLLGASNDRKIAEETKGKIEKLGFEAIVTH